MICYDCVLKHLSTALSYGKQILSGHSLGNELDHRIDFLGQIVNAEQHLELFEKDLFIKLSDYRKDIQAKNIMIDFQDLEFIRKLFLEVELIKSGNNAVQGLLRLSQDIDIVFDRVDNLEWFQLSYNSLKKHLKDYRNIYILGSEVDLSGYADIQVVDQDLYSFTQDDRLSSDFVYMYQNTGFLKDLSVRNIKNSFSVFNDSKNVGQIIKYIRSKGIQGSIYNYDGCKAQLLNKDLFAQMADYNGNYPITAYSYSMKKTTKNRDVYQSVYVDRSICCSMKSALKQKIFVRWNEKGFNSLKEYLTNQENKK